MYMYMRNVLVYVDHVDLHVIFISKLIAGLDSLLQGAIISNVRVKVSIHVHVHVLYVHECSNYHVP